MNTYTINVTQEDIDHGRRGDCGKCPVARAAKRVFPDASWVSVTDNIQVGWDWTARYEQWNLPVSAERFVYDFDEGEPVEPFEFIITLCDEG